MKQDNEGAGGTPEVGAEVAGMLEPTPTMREQVLAANWVCDTAGEGASADALSLACLMAGRRAEACTGVRSVERERCLAVIDDMIDAAESRRKGHHATPWLRHARDAIASGIDPRELEDGALQADNCDGEP